MSSQDNMSQVYNLPTLTLSFFLWKLNISVSLLITVKSSLIHVPALSISLKMKHFISPVWGYKKQFVHFIFRYDLQKRKLKDILKTKIWRCGYSWSPLCYQDLHYMEWLSEGLVHKLSATVRRVSDRSRQIHSRWQNNSVWTSSPLTMFIDWAAISTFHPHTRAVIVAQGHIYSSPLLLMF